jgi:hypothetical protein
MVKRKAIDAPAARAWLSAERDRPRYACEGDALQLAVAALEALDAGDADAALVNAFDLGKWIGRDSVTAALMGLAAEAELKAERLQHRDAKRVHRSRDSKRATKAQKVFIAQQLLAGYKGAKKTRAYSEIGRKVAELLKLPKPIKGETVRGWFKNANR